MHQLCVDAYLSWALVFLGGPTPIVQMGPEHNIICYREHVTCVNAKNAADWAFYAMNSSETAECVEQPATPTVRKKR
jgi:hypothetical protein